MSEDVDCAVNVDQRGPIKYMNGALDKKGCSATIAFAVSISIAGHCLRVTHLQEWGSSNSNHHAQDPGIADPSVVGKG